MNYIVFDMEWNQPAPWKKLKYEHDRCLHNEIIQIGAVKLNSKCEYVDNFTVNIKPSVHKEINKNVQKLTGIDDELLEDAMCLKDAIEQFRQWCGEDYVFITWGYDDIHVLGENLKYFGFDTSWLPGCYNLQMIFCAQTDNENRQYSLSYATDYFKIALDKPFHNALADAYYTAEVCAKLDIEQGISKYRAMVFKDKSIPEHMKNILYKKNYKQVTGYDNIIKTANIKSPVCCECGEKLEIIDSAANGMFCYLVIGKCPEHGEIAQQTKINKTEENVFCATKHYFAVDEYNREYFTTRLKKMRASAEKRKRMQAKKLNENTSSNNSGSRKHAYSGTNA